MYNYVNTCNICVNISCQYVSTVHSVHIFNENMTYVYMLHVQVYWLLAGDFANTFTVVLWPFLLSGFFR